jgi:cell division protein FtsB
MIKFYIAIVVMGLVGGAVYGAKYYYDTTQNTIAALRDNNAKLEIANETNTATINQLNNDARLTEAENAELQVSLQAAEAYKDELVQKLQRHDLSRLSVRKPGLIERRINDGTAKVFDDLENLTRPNGASAN